MARITSLTPNIRRATRIEGKQQRGRTPRLRTYMHSGCGPHPRCGESNSYYQSLGYESWKAKDVQGWPLELDGGRSEMLTVDSQTLHTPNVQFQIEQMVLNPTGKLLAVAGATQVAVIVLPRAPYSRTLSPTIECRQFGLFYS